jgi:VanZ family protein
MPLPSDHAMPAVTHIFLLIQNTHQAVDKKTVMAIATYAAFSVVLPLLLGTLGIRKLTPALRCLLLLLAFALFTEAAGLILGRGDQPNLWIYNTYTAVEYSLLIIMFVFLLDGKLFRRVLLASIPLFIVIWVLATLNLEKSDPFHGVFLSIESVVFAILAVATLVKEMRDSSTLLVDNPIFWVSAGVLVYFAGNLLVFAFIDKLLQTTLKNSEVGMYSGWLIHTAMNVSKNILFAIGFLSTGGPSNALRPIMQFFRRTFQRVKPTIPAARSGK